MTARLRRSTTLATLAAHSTAPPPALGCIFRSLVRNARPPMQSAMLEWARTHSFASALAGLACAFLKSRDAERVLHLLRAGRHGQSAQCFCGRFSQRHFPLDHAWAGDGEARLLVVEITRGIQHEGFGDNWEEYADLWSVRPVFVLSWALMQDPYGALRDEYFEDEFPTRRMRGLIARAMRPARLSRTSPINRSTFSSAGYRSMASQRMSSESASTAPGGSRFSGRLRGCGAGAATPSSIYLQMTSATPKRSLCPPSSTSRRSTAKRCASCV